MQIQSYPNKEALPAIGTADASLLYRVMSVPVVGPLDNVTRFNEALYCLRNNDLGVLTYFPVMPPTVYQLPMVGNE